jgi:hypothetical protein
MKDKRKHLTATEVDKLITATKGVRHEARDRCLLLLMFRHGLRGSEACGLLLSHVNIESPVLHVARLKMGLSTTHPLRPDEIRTVKAWLTGRAKLKPEAAAAAKLFIVAAGAPDAVDACLPLFEALGQKTFNFGDNPQAANLVKLSGNFLIAATIEALGEAMALVGKAGVDRGQYVDFLTSTLFNAPIYKIYGRMIAEQQFEPAGFAAPLGYKDMRLTLAAADALRVPMPLASLLRDRFLTLFAHGGENLDWSAIARLAAEDAGQQRQGPG